MQYLTFHHMILLQPPEAMGAGGKDPIRWNIFVTFQNNRHFNVIRIKLRTLLEPFKRAKLLRFGIHLKN